MSLSYKSFSRIGTMLLSGNDKPFIIEKNVFCQEDWWVTQFMSFYGCWWRRGNMTMQRNTISATCALSWHCQWGWLSCFASFGPEESGQHWPLRAVKHPYRGQAPGTAGIDSLSSIGCSWTGLSTCALLARFQGLKPLPLKVRKSFSIRSERGQYSSRQEQRVHSWILVSTGKELISFISLTA